MLLAELQMRHSRVLAPTRRVALGELWLPTDPAPGYGGILLAAVVGRYSQGLESESEIEDLLCLIDDLDAGRVTPQRRMRHRFQSDAAGLESSSFRLWGRYETLSFESEMRGTSVQAVLAAVYATAQLPNETRSEVFSLIKRAVHYVGTSEEALLRAITNNTFADSSSVIGTIDPKWAKVTLGFKESEEPSRGEIVKRFRSLVRVAHPDHGGERTGAGLKVGDLLRAKRILLAFAA